MSKGKLRLYCFKNDDPNPFIFDLPALEKVGHPVSTNTIFEITGCDRILMAAEHHFTLDLRKEVDEI
jgi:hypothetical protein